VTAQVFLQDLVIILTAAVAVVVLLGRVKVPSIAGFIVAGTLIGPYALGLVHDLHQVEVLAELGAVMLLFGIGLELSLDRVRKLWKPILLGGAIQVGTTITLVTGLGLLFGLRFGTALLLGFIVAVSSTAIVLKGLSLRGELGAPHGRITLGILIFQDLCVVPMVLVIPFLGGAGSGQGQTGAGVIVPLLTAAAVVIGVLFATRMVVPRFLEAIARTRQRELFVLAVFLVCLGTAWSVASAGVSLALGAFLAGLVVSGSRYREQAISDLVPLRDVLASVFFVSIGMLLNLSDALSHLLPILALFAAIVVGKFVIILLTACVLRVPLRVAVLSASSLSQVGEFSFVLLVAAGGAGLLSGPLQSNLTVAIILSMLVTPLAIAAAPWLANTLAKWAALREIFPQRRTREPPEDSEERPLREHVIIAGFGLTGRYLARSLAHRGTPFVIVDLNTDNVRDGRRRGLPVHFGDVTSPEVLEHLGIVHARELVICVNDTIVVIRATRVARRTAPRLRITVRTIYEADVTHFEDAGATEVFPAEVAVANVISDSVIGNLEGAAGL